MDLHCQILAGKRIKKNCNTLPEIKDCVVSLIYYHKGEYVEVQELSEKDILIRTLDFVNYVHKTNPLPN
ncbi:hypothetical protein HMI54_007782, partial [Coelomomyces lativittatus]